MKTFQKWAMAAAAMTAGFGIAAPAMAGISAKDIAKSHELRHLNLTQLRQVILTNFGR